VRFYPDNGQEPFLLDVYISIDSPDNIYYDPNASVDQIVETIIRSKGQSGTNLEYALRLAHIHRKFGIFDEHVFEIESRLLEICKANQVKDKILHTLGYFPQAA
jgi:cation transport regulator ChaC